MLSKTTTRQILWALSAAILIAGIFILNQRAESPFEKINTVEFTFKTDRLDPKMAALVKEGQKVLNSPGGQVIGNISSFEIQPHSDSVTAGDGTIKRASDPYYKNVLINVRAKGYANDDLVALHNEVIQAGTTYKLNTSIYVFDGKITSIEILDE